MATAKTQVNNTTPAINQRHFRRPGLRREAEIMSVTLITADKEGVWGRRGGGKASCNQQCLNPENYLPTEAGGPPPQLTKGPNRTGLSAPGSATACSEGRHQTSDKRGWSLRPPETARHVQCQALLDPQCHSAAHTAPAACTPSALDHSPRPSGCLQVVSTLPPFMERRRRSRLSENLPHVRHGRWRIGTPPRADSGADGAPARSGALPPHLLRSRRPRNPRGR